MKMKNRFYINPLLYGAILGGISALIGSMLFALIGLIVLTGFRFNFEGFLYTFSMGIRLFLTFSLVPGIVGGVFLGYLFSRHKFSRIKGILYGMSAGATAAIAAIAIFFILTGSYFFDVFIFGYVILAIFIAAIMAGITSFVLMKTNLTRVEAPDTL